MSDVLHEILHETAQAAQHGRKTLAVFDLDSTLFDLRPRIEKIVHDFARERASGSARDPARRAVDPDACRLLLDVRIEARDWGLAKPLARVGIFVAEHPLLFAELQAHWVERFFGNDYLSHDLLVPGAVEFVRELEAVGGDVLYLTGRDVPRMLTGTIAQLKATGFPLDDERARLILKPVAELDDADFKADVLLQELAVYDRIWFFENEPVNLRVARERCPKVELVFIDTNHSGREQPWAELASIPHFATDLTEFRAFRAAR